MYKKIITILILLMIPFFAEAGLLQDAWNSFWGIGQPELGATVCYPYQGCTGQDTSDWTGYLYVTGGTWSTTTAGVSDFASLDDVSLTSTSTGDVLYFDGSDWVNLGIGSADEVLKVSGGLPSWGTDETGAAAAGQWSTSTYGIYYNSGDVVMGDTSTTTSAFWFDYTNDILYLNDLELANALTNDQIASSTEFLENTTYSAGTLLDLVGTTFNVNDDLSQYDNSTSSFLTVETDPIWNASSGDYVAWADASTTNWDIAYSWGDHSLGGYLTENQSITISGDASGSGTTSISIGLATDSVADNEIDYTNVTLADFTNDGDYATTGQLHSAITLNTTSYDYLSLAGQQITLGQIDISDDTNLATSSGITLTGDTLGWDPTGLDWGGNAIPDDKIASSTEYLADEDTTYSATGTLLDLTSEVFSINEGTLTNNKYCIYVDGTGIVCNSDDSDTQLTQEEVEDYAGAMVDSNTETLITVTYQDGDGTLDFIVNDDLSQYDNSTSSFLTESPFGAAIDASELASADFGSFTCDGSNCWLDDDSVTSSIIATGAVGDDAIDYTSVTLADFTDDINNATTGTALSDFSGSVTDAQVPDDITITDNATTGVTTLSSLTSIGTIGTGVWEGTAINDTYIASSAEYLADNDTTYSATGTLLDLTGTTFSLNEGTLTNNKYCIYVDGTGIVCNSDPSGGGDMLKSTYDSDEDNFIDTAAGGTEADSSGWTGFVYITGGSWGTSSIDISDHTNLAGGIGITLSGDTLNLDNDFGADINASELASEDFGSFTCNGTNCWLDADSVTSSIIATNAVGDDAMNYSEVTLADFTDDINNATTGTALSDFSGSVTDAQVPDDITISLPNDSIDAAHINTINAGRSLTWDTTNDEMDADAELYTHTFTMVSEATTTYNGTIKHALPSAITITEIRCTTDTGTTTVQLDERGASTPNTGGTDIMTSALACGTIATTSSFNNSGIAADAWINLDIDSVSGVNSTSTVNVNVKYEIND